MGSVPVAALCQGFSKVDGLAMSNTAVSDVSTSARTNALATVNYTVCKGQREVMVALGLQESLAVQYNGNVAIDEKLKFVHSLQVTTKSVTILIHSRKSLGSLTVTQTALRSDVMAPATDEELRQFFRCYGDSFVSEIEHGGEYIASYTFYSQSQEEQQQVCASIAASGMGPWGNVNDSLAVQLKSVTKESKVRAEFHEHMSGIENRPSPTPEHCIDFALDFSGKVLDVPGVIAFTTSGYECIPKMDRFQRIAGNRDLLAGGSTTDTRSFRGLLLGVQGLKNAIRQIKDIHTFYGIHTQRVDPMLSSVEGQADADERSLHATMKSYFEDPLGQLTIPTELPSLSHSDGRTPILQIATSVAGYNPDNHINFNDVVDAMAFVQQFTKINSIALWSDDDVILKFRVVYSSGHLRHEEPGSSCKTVDHGRRGLSEMPQSSLTVPRGDQVTSMACSLGHFHTCSLELFHTLLGPYFVRPPLQLVHLTLTIGNGSSVSGGGNVNKQTSNLKYGGGDSLDNSFMLGFQGFATNHGLSYLQLI